MEASKVVYVYRSPRQIIRKHNIKEVIKPKDRSNKSIRIEANTPTIYRPVIPTISPSNSVISSSKQKRSRITYKPNSSVYKKLNAKLTLNILEFNLQSFAEPRVETRSQMRKMIDFTIQKKNLINLEPLEARGCSMNSISVSN